MNKLYKSFLPLFFVFILFPNEGFCSHIVGGSLTYVYNGGTSYTVTLKLYRDCASGNSGFDATAYIQVQQANGSEFSPSRDFSLATISTSSVTPVLPPCATSPATTPCVQERIYQATVNLAAAPGGMHLYYQVCCRNASISNITTPASEGESYYSFIPCYNSVWTENFTLANGTTSDAGATAWTRAMGLAPPASAQVNNGLFEVTANTANLWLEDFTLADGTTSDAGATAWTRTVTAATAQVNSNQFIVTGANSGSMTWSSQVINIAAYTDGINLNISLAEADFLEATDVITISYSINGGAAVQFPINGLLADDFTSAVAYASGLSGNTIQLFVNVQFSATSPATEIYTIDNITVSPVEKMVWSSEVINIAAYASGVNLSVNLIETANLDTNDNITVSYSLNGGAAVNFPTNGSLRGDFPTALATVLATATGLVGTTIQIFVTTNQCGVSPGEIYQIDMVSVYDNTFMPNSNPAFDITPPLFFCQGVQDTIDYSATDANGDVLVYSLFTPYENASPCCFPYTAPAFTDNIPTFTPVNWQAGYSATSPFNSGGPALSINAATGEVSGIANTLGRFVFGVKCQEYRGGVYLGETTRGYQVTTVVCPPFVPSAPTTGTNNPSPICEGQTLSLTASTIAGATGYSWSGPNGFTSSLQNPTIANVTTAASGTYSVYASVSGCNGAIGTLSVTVTPTPVAPAAGSNSPVCSGQTLSLTSNTIASASYAWTGPNSFTSTAEDPTIPSVTTAGTGNYSVTATVAGCTSAAGTTSVTVNATPAAPVASSNSPVCAGSTLSLNASTITGAIYAWTGPNSFSSALQNPTIVTATTAASGTYSVTATVAGCTGTAGTTSVTVNGIPAAPTASSNSPVCSGSTLNLSASVITGATYSWTGPNGFSSASQNPSIPAITTAGAGNYSVTATVAGCLGLAGTTSVTINLAPGAPVVSSNSPVCAGSTLSLNASTITGAIYAWTGPNSFSSALQNPTIVTATTAASGTYSVTATVAGCSGIAGTTSVTINPIPSAPTASSNSPVCAGSTLSLTANTISGATYSWTGPNSFSSALQNPTISGIATTASGTYSVTATVSGCLGTVGTTSVTVNGTPAAPIAGSNSPMCIGTTLSLTASTITGAIYSWTGPNSFSSASQNPTIAGVTTSHAGTYSVTATVSGCPGPAGTVSVTISPPPATPTAGSNSPICTGYTLSLTATTILSATYSWTGPNGFSSASQNPTIANITTTGAGTYSVTATVAGCAGSAGTTVVTVNVAPASPNASSNSPVCAGQTLNLTATATGISYNWAGPNGFSSASQNPSISGVTTAASGTYSVTATGANGCISTPANTTSVTINPTPTAPLVGSNSPACLGGDISLTATTFPGATYSWTGPNGFSSTTQNPVITGVSASDAGTYSVVATISGCVGPVGTGSVIVNSASSTPVLGSNSPMCTGQTLSLTTATVPSATYNWSGPNAFTSSLEDPTIAGVTVASAGTYSLFVTVPGCVTSGTGTLTVTINITPSAPTPVSNNSPVCSGNDLSLSSATMGGVTYNWNGPNSFTSISEDPVILAATTATTGTYSVSVTSVAGCTSAAASTVAIINQIPSAPTAGNNGSLCTGTTLSLTASTIAGATYSWTGPGGYSSSSQNPTILNVTTADAGTYSVIATVAGCTGTAGTTSVTITIPQTTTPGSNSPICAGQTLSLSATTVASASYAWTGPNGFLSSLQNPTIPNATTAAGGTYSVTATLSGCTSAATMISVTVNPTPSITASNNSPLCEGNTLSLTASNSGGTYSWNGPNGFSSALQNPTIPTVTTAASGTYSVTATLNGCTSSVGTTSVTVNPPPSPPSLGNNGPLCSGFTLSLTASTVVGATYSWVGPNSFSSASQNPTIGNVTTLASGTYSVIATVAGCPPLSTVTTLVTINQTPSAPVAGSNSPLCVGDNLTLTASSTGSTYSWNGPNGFSSALQNPVINTVGTINAGTYTVNTSSVAGCVSTDAILNVVINPPPAAPIAGSNSPLCSGSTLSLTASTIANATYIWNGPNSFSSAVQNPIIGGVTTLASGTYSVTAAVPGCATSPAGTVSVTVNQSPAAPTATSNSPVCSGNDISLSASTVGGASYSWTGPNGFSSSLQNPVIVAATTANTGVYSVTATENGCAGSAGTTSVIVNATPLAPIAGNNGPLCVGDNLSLTANTIAGAIYSWTGPNGFSSALQNPIINTVSTADAGTYSVSVSVAGCLGTVGTTSVIIAPPPTAPVAGNNSPVCSGAILSLTASTISGATSYNWNGPNGFSSSTQNPIIGSVTTLASGTYSVSATVAGCTGPVGTTSVTINQTPSSPITSNNGPLCIGDNLSLTAGTITGATYSWAGPNGFSSSSQNPVINNTTTADAGIYSVIATANGCTGTVGSTTVIVSPPPSTPIAGSNSPVCSGSTLSLTSNTIVGATYSWSGANSFSSAVQNPTIGGVTTLASGTYSVFVRIGSCTSPTGTVSVIVSQSPAAPTATSNSPVCSGNDISLSASTVGGASYSWTGPNGFSSSLQNPVIVAATTANTGVYSVTATENGCAGSAGTTSVIVNATPLAPIAGNNGPLCVGDNLSLTANTIAGAIYSWTGPNGFSSALQNPIINIVSTTDAGTYSVSVSVAGCLGAVGTTSVIIAPPPLAPVAGSNSPVCSGTTLSLTASGISGATYSWTGPNGFSSSSQNPTIAGIPTSNEGIYSVVLKIGSCTSPAGTVSVTVNPSPPAPTISSNSPLCIGDNLSLTASTIAGVTYNWNGPNNFSSSSQNPVINTVGTINAGTYSVSITSIANGCVSATSTQTISVTFPASVNAGSDQTVCANNPAQLSGIITGGSGTGAWSTPNGVGFFTPNTTDLNATYTPSINDTLVQNVFLILSSTNNGGCSVAKDTILIHVNRGPVVNAGANQSICSNNYSTVNINGSVQFAGGGIWNSTGTGSFQSATTILTNTYVPTSADVVKGNVMLVLSSTGNGSCSAVNDSVLITFTPAPIVNAGATISICFGDTSAQLNGMVSGGATTGQWSTLGTGTFSPNNTTLNAIYFLSHADTAAGGVTLILTSTNFGNCLAVSNTVLVTMTNAPTVSAGPDITVCSNNNTVSLNGNISGSSTTGYWSTNGTGIFIPDSSKLNATYIPSAADTADGSITLTLTSTKGCRSIADSLIVTITNAPVANAGVDVLICEGGSVALNGSINSASAGGHWTTSGNGTFVPNDSTLNATYVLGSKDTSIVKITLTTRGNGQCFAAKDSMTITIGKKPIAGFSVPHICVGQSIKFTDTSSVVGLNDTIVSWKWKINNNTVTLQNPIYSYTSAGKDTVVLIVTTALGCSDTAIHILNINPTPTASFTALTTCSLDSVYFSSTSTISSGKIISWSWNFGDTKTSTLQNPVHYYDSLGTYIVTLTATSDSGCTSTFVDTIIPSKGAIAGFSFTTDCNNNVNFTNASITATSDSVISWSWNFGDGSALNTNQNPSHTYSNTGTYVVILHIVTQGGCSDSVSNTVLLLPAPVADFAPKGGTYNTGTTIAFTDLSTNAVTWMWNFGDGGSDIIQNPSHPFNQNGTLNVMLIVTNTNGCPDTVKYSFLFNTNIVVVPSAFTPNEDGVNDLLLVRGGPLKEMDWRIYNEWGNEVFHATSQSEGWNGRYKGKIQPESRYVFILKGITFGNEMIELNGEVTILR